MGEMNVKAQQETKGKDLHGEGLKWTDEVNRCQRSEKERNGSEKDEEQAQLRDVDVDRRRRLLVACVGDDVSHVENETNGDQTDEAVRGKIADEYQRRDGTVHARHASRVVVVVVSR